MKAAVIFGTATHQALHGAALLEGLRRHGIDARHLSSDVRPDGLAFAACWGWRLGKKLKARGHRVLVMERGYVGDRVAWTSLGWDGLNGRARFPRVDDGGARWRQHFAHLMRPWRGGGERIVIMGQVPGDMSIEGVDMPGWYEQAVKTCRRGSYPVCFRPHPVAAARGHREWIAGAETLTGDLAAALDRTAYVVTYNSNSAVDAIMAGVPAVACDDHSMAWEVAGHGLQSYPPAPDRTAWAHRIAWCQWSLDELRSGAAYEAARSVAHREAVAA